MTNEKVHPLKGHVLTIDGPSASGKGTLARRLSKRYLAKYLDTGTIYRAGTYLALKEGIDLQDIPHIVAFFKEMELDFRHVGNNKFESFYKDVSIEKFIRTPEVDQHVSFVATQPEIRQVLFDRQVDFALKWKDVYGVILDGRDTGGRIYPKALVKIFVEADARIRAERRAAQFSWADVDRVYADLVARDEGDAPNIICTPDALVLNSGTMTPDEMEEKAAAFAAAQGVLEDGFLV